MTQSKAYAAQTAKSKLEPFNIERREVFPSDIKIQIEYCGVCHSDIHTARGEWAGVAHPVVPGHEIIGKVVEVGNTVKQFKVGDTVGVGCLVDSCRNCRSCSDGLEQYCDNYGMVFTYNSPDKYFPGKMTYGGYSSTVVVDEKFVLRIPGNLDPAGAAPLLCAGITTYSPLKHWNVGSGKKVGVVGLGGLGHMALKFSHAFGAKTVLFTTSESKINDAKRLGADDVILSNDPEAIKAHIDSFDFILNTVAASHNLDTYSGLLKRDGTLCLVGVPEHPHPSPNIGNLIFRRRNIAGSLIGGIKETQEMLDFCGTHNIVSDIELISIKDINQAYDRMIKGDVKYRFVIDNATL